MNYRLIVASDIAELFAVRVSVHENVMSMAELESAGFTEDSVREMLVSSLRGWLAEEDGRIVGFAIGNRTNGEMSVVAVLPEYEGRGVGAGVLSRVESWVFAQGWDEMWLTTSVDMSYRAYGFYCHQGWRDTGVRDGLRYMKKSCAPPRQ